MWYRSVGRSRRVFKRLLTTRLIVWCFGCVVCDFGFGVWSSGFRKTMWNCHATHLDRSSVHEKKQGTELMTPDHTMQRPERARTEWEVTDSSSVQPESKDPSKLVL
jgi:hypothetical protein